MFPTDPGVVTDTEPQLHVLKTCSAPRRGKWSSEEEVFAASLIADFEAGLIPSLENGATLRAFLSKKLNCSAMRISKKFAGDIQCARKCGLSIPLLVFSSRSQPSVLRRRQVSREANILAAACGCPSGGSQGAGAGSARACLPRTSLR